MTYIWFDIFKKKQRKLYKKLKRLGYVPMSWSTFYKTDEVNHEGIAITYILVENTIRITDIGFSKSVTLLNELHTNDIHQGEQNIKYVNMYTIS